jgi:transposase-like protein
MPKPTSNPDTQVTPNPALEKRGRRTYTAEYKLSILAKADACKHGELGDLLRKEKLYSNQLTAWRCELAENGVAGLSKSAPGPIASKTMDQKRIEQLIKENDRLKNQLAMANDCLDLQKKALLMLDRMNTGNEA